MLKVRRLFEIVINIFIVDQVPSRGKTPGHSVLITGGFQKARMAEPDRNFIIIPVCLPDSQTQLSVVITDAVKIYDLASGVLSPAYCLLVNSGKIRDVVFVHNDSGLMHLLLISSAGHVFFQQLRDESSARHGSFSVTNIMDLPHGVVRNSGGSLSRVGVSIYFSHTLQILFCSYAQGKSFFAPQKQVTEKLSAVFPIQVG